ncbi:MAG TPA: hypothetical protein VIP70_09970 [Nitrososphaeraceae archaeon]|jgi:hypothetical protein
MKKKSIISTGVVLVMALGVILTSVVPATSVFAQDALSNMTGAANQTAGNMTGAANQTAGNMTGGNQSGGGNPLEQLGEQFGKLFGGK